MNRFTAWLVGIALAVAFLAACGNLTTAERNRERQRIERSLERGEITPEAAQEQLDNLDTEDGNALLWTAIAANVLLGIANTFQVNRRPRQVSP